MQINKGTNTIGSFDKKQKDTTDIISTVTTYKIEAKAPLFLLIWTITGVYPIVRMMKLKQIPLNWTHVVNSFTPILAFVFSILSLQFNWQIECFEIE